MVREQEPARSPLQPSQGRTPGAVKSMNKNEAQPPQSPSATKPQPIQSSISSPQPVFGKPTPLGLTGEPLSQTQSTQTVQRSANIGVQRQKDPYSNLFVHRPQLHKPTSGSNPLLQFNRPVKKTSAPQPTDQQQRTQSQSSSLGLPARSNTIGSKPIPYRDFDDDVFEISKPVTWKPNAPQHPIFSSSHSINPFLKPKANFVDLTMNSIGSSTNRSLWDDQHGYSDPLMFIDTAKANEQLKALFEGGIGDEVGKQRIKRKKKGVEGQLNGLAEQMGDLNVKDKKQETSTEVREDDDVEEEEDDGTREGLKVKLLPHQIDGVEWMRSKEMGREDGKGKTSGGLLADDMGLGKTIQSIALIMSNPKPTKSSEQSDTKTDGPRYDKGTLVVAPLALIKQWEGEIKDRIEKDHALNVCVHHGPKRSKSYKELQKFDVVITTYSTLSSEHESSNENLPVGCFGVKWHRVILDEAHSIKNRNAKSTKAACALQAQYRWCLSGTPMQNNLDELQSLIHFLRIAPLDKLEYWREHITRPMSSGRGGLAIQRLQAVLGNIMKRRTKDVLKEAGGLNASKPEGSGKAGSQFQLVKRTVEAVEVDFTHRERSFYKRLESRTDQRLEMMMAGNKMSYASALVLLMRLRQACNHPKLIGSDLNSDRDNLADSGAQTPRKKANRHQDDTDDLTLMLGGLSVKTKLCDVCQIELTTAQVEDGELRCSDCEADLSWHESLGKDRTTKKKDRKALAKMDRKVNRRVIIDSDDEDGDAHTSQEKAIDLTEENGSSEAEEEEEDEDEGSTDEDDLEEFNAADLVSSTKIRHLISILRNDAHNHKYIVFSVFTSMLDLIEPFLRQSHINFVRYDGSMRNDMREASLNDLRHNPTVRVLLCSLRAGSLGLNLTAASRVVVLEPFWNPFVEEQAIDRVHRLNQTKDVVVYKLTVKDTVESRILELQEKKRALAKATVEGHQASGVAKLTMAEMLKLFDHKAEHDARVDMLGMQDRRGLLVDGESTEDTYSSPPSQLQSSRDFKHENGDRDRSRQREDQPGRKERRKVDEIYSRRW